MAKTIDKTSSNYIKTKQRFLKYIEAGKSLKYKDFKNTDPSLLYAIERYCGNITKISNDIGITNDDLNNKYGLSKNINAYTLSETEIIKRLEYLQSINNVTTSAMRTEFDDLRLERSLKKRYGSVSEALLLLGFKRSTKTLSKEQCDKKIMNYSKKGFDMSYSSMNNIDRKLVNRVSSIYKNWSDGVTCVLGDSFQAKRQTYSEESIKKRLQKMLLDYPSGLNSTIICAEDSSVYAYSQLYFSSLQECLIHFNIPYLINDRLDLISYGREFELLMKDVFDALGIPIIYNRKKGNYRPDFQFNESHIGDAKLSLWTPSIPSTIANYKSISSKLTIFYLMGKNSDTIVDDYASFCHVKNLFPKLDNANRQDIIKKIIKLEEKVKESVTTERLESNHSKECMIKLQSALHI